MLARGTREEDDPEYPYIMATLANNRAVLHLLNPRDTDFLSEVKDFITEASTNEKVKDDELPHPGHRIVHRAVMKSPVLRASLGECRLKAATYENATKMCMYSEAKLENVSDPEDSGKRLDCLASVVEGFESVQTRGRSGLTKYLRHAVVRMFESAKEETLAFLTESDKFQREERTHPPDGADKIVGQHSSFYEDCGGILEYVQIRAERCSYHRCRHGFHASSISWIVSRLKKKSGLC